MHMESPEWMRNNITAALGDTTNALAKNSTLQSLGLDEAQIKTYTPYAAAAGVGAAAFVFSDPLKKVGKGAVKLVKNVVTGFGIFERIPLVGGLFSGAGKIIEKGGDYAGYALGAAASFLTFQLFQSKPSPIDVKPYQVPDAGTGAKPQEPDFVEVKGQRVPEKPKQVVPTAVTLKAREENKQIAGVQSHEMLRDMRIKTMRDAKADPILAEQLRALMQEENQRYENRRQFIKRAEEFAGKQPGSSRNNLVALMMAQGMSDTEAKNLVPDKPDLRRTVTLGAKETENSTDSTGKADDFAGDYKQLLAFADRVEGFYGKGYFEVSERTADGKAAAVRKSYKEMSVTQLQEYIQTAINHVSNKYTKYKPLVRETSSVVGATRVSVSVSHSVDFSALEKGSETYRDGNGNPKVVTWKQEYDFVSGINGDTVSHSSGFPTAGVAFHSSGTTLRRGDNLVGIGSSFAGWQTLLDKHREDLRFAEVAYGGEIRGYGRKVKLMQQSVKMMDEQKIALIDRGPGHIIIRDLRQHPPGTPAADKDLMTLHGEWVPAPGEAAGSGNEQKFAVRAFSTAHGKMTTLPQAVTVDLDQSASFAPLMQSTDLLKKAKVEQKSPYVVLAVDNTPGNARMRVADTRSGVTHEFAGTFEGENFIATGIVEQDQMQLPQRLPPGQEVPRKNITDYNKDGDNAVTGSYIWGGTVYREVSVRDKEDKVRTVVLIGNQAAALIQEGTEYRNYAWYNSKQGPDIVPGSKLDITFHKDTEYEMRGKIAVSRMDNAVIEAENRARLKAYQASLTPKQMQVITPYGEAVRVEKAGHPESWEALMKKHRFKISGVQTLVPNSKPAALKAYGNFIQVKDAQLEFKGNVRLHGTYKGEAGQFVVEALELRPEGLDGLTAGTVTALPYPSTLSAENPEIGALMDHLAAEMKAKTAAATEGGQPKAVLPPPDASKTASAGVAK